MGTAIVEEDKQMVYNRNIILQEEIKSEYNNTIQMKMKKEKKSWKHKTSDLTDL